MRTANNNDNTPGYLYLLLALAIFTVAFAMAVAKGMITLGH